MLEVFGVRHHLTAIEAYFASVDIDEVQLVAHPAYLHLHRTLRLAPLADAHELLIAPHGRQPTEWTRVLKADLDSLIRHIEVFSVEFDMLAPAVLASSILFPGEHSRLLSLAEVAVTRDGQ